MHWGMGLAESESEHVSVSKFPKLPLEGSAQTRPDRTDHLKKERAWPEMSHQN